MVSANSKSGGVPDDGGGGSSSVPSLLPPPRPQYLPEYPDLYGKRRQTAKVLMLEREIGFLEDELKCVQTLQPASIICKEVSDFVGGNSDPLIPTKPKSRSSCRRFWNWLCGLPCFDLSWICCFWCSECSPCHFRCFPGFSGCLRLPSCCSCDISNCCFCFLCSSSPSCSWCCSCSCKCSCSCPRSNCCKRIKPSCSSHCCACQPPLRPDCCCCTWLCCCPKWTCSTPKCPKLHFCCNCTQTCRNPCFLFF